jgi:FlaA1/EpsC-like NDP-sugar epimerase
VGRETVKLVSGNRQVIDNALSIATVHAVACPSGDLTDREESEAEVDDQVGNSAKGTARSASRAPSAKQAFVIASDLLIWPVALAIATSFYGRNPFEAPTPVLAAVAIVAQLVVGHATGLYRGHFKRFSFDEAGAVAITAGSVGALLIALEFIIANEGRAGQVLLLATSLAVCLMFGHRYLRRIRAERIAATAHLHRMPVIVYGAGDGGYRAISSMQAVRSSPYRPVALIDDDPAMRHRRISSLRVEGTSADLDRLAAKYGAKAVLLAMPSASGEELHRLNAVVHEAGLETLVMPPVQRLVGEGSPGEFTRYRDEDILNRRIVDIDPEAVRNLVTGSRVLVTGAGGTIGSELIRQLAEFEPASLIALDRDDSLLHHVVHSLAVERRSLCLPVIADIRDADRLDEVWTRHRPQLVFHAAALKHVPALEGAPSEGWKTNVLGTGNVLEVSERHRVDRVVNISTDKAADPENVLGYTKRIAERLTAASARRTGRPFVSVRFGNVIGSRGSAIETFELQIRNGGPVTITHPDVTRYFMAVREAVRLTMQAAAIGRGAEVLVLDMGTPVRVLDVARQLIERSGANIEIVYTGLRPGEKMHEVLLGDGEAADRPLHPMIDHVSVPALELVHGLDACAAANLSPLTLDGLMAVAYSTTKNQTVRLGDSPQADTNGPTSRRTT